MKHKSVLGVSFAENTSQDVLNKARECWQKKARVRIATVNPEYLVDAEKNKNLKQNLQKAEVKVLDGFGLWLALKIKGFAGERIPGANLTEKLLELAEKEKRSVAVIIKKGGLSSVAQVKSILQKKYPQLLFSVRDEAKLSDIDADLTLIATGIPDQEYQAENISRGVVMGIGGSIDFLTRAQIRAPKILQFLGLEWLWRLILQPKRFKRIWNAVVVFPLLVIFDKKRAGSA